MTISRREREYLRCAVIFGWRINETPRGKGYWEADLSMPVATGPTLEGLIHKGLFERIPDGRGGAEFRATAAAGAYRCRANNCQRGEVFVGLSDEPEGVCPVCEGTGLVLKSTS